MTPKPSERRKADEQPPAAGEPPWRLRSDRFQWIAQDWNGKRWTSRSYHLRLEHALRWLLDQALKDAPAARAGRGLEANVRAAIGTVEAVARQLEERLGGAVSACSAALAAEADPGAVSGSDAQSTPSTAP